MLPRALLPRALLPRALLPGALLPLAVLPRGAGFAPVTAQELADHAGQQVAQSGRTG
ncbi:hypothetical protein [Actinoplanes sp. NPDC049118]|uniref:hypothetical protein n=1 Tax=Actinoplanes sp. NPDC049118 TaxID=3155769 RepID=UPI0033C92C44